MCIKIIRHVFTQIPQRGGGGGVFNYQNNIELEGLEDHRPRPTVRRQ